MGEERESAGSATRGTIRALVESLPKLMEAYNAQVLPTAQAQFSADASVSPRYAELATDIYRQYGPEAARIAAGIEDIAQRAASQREVDIARGPGRELVDIADRYQRQLDPEYYKFRERLASGLDDYLNRMAAPVTENELEAVRRGMGVQRSNSAMDTVANALQFADRQRQRDLDFGAALAQAAQSIPVMRSGMGAFEIATRRPLAPTGGERVMMPVMNTGQQAYSAGNNLLGQIGAFKQTEMARQKSLFDNVTGWAGFGGRVIGSIAGALG